MKGKDTLFLCALFLVAVTFYLLGVRNGYRHRTNMMDAQQQLSEAQFRLMMCVKIESLWENADLQRARSDLGMLILMQTREYEQRFGPPSKADRFAQSFDQARLIADQVEAGLVPLESIGKQFGSNVTIRVTEE
jgi:hypothetical protein